MSDAGRSVDDTVNQPEPAGVEIVSRRVLHHGRKFDFETVSVRADGRVLQRDLVRHPGAVVILPVLDGGDLVMIRNVRVAVGRTLLELPAGTLEPPEPPEKCAARELVEETGYRAATVTPLGWFYTTPGLTDERMHAFVATGLEQVGQRLEDDEQIVVEQMPVERVFALLDEGVLVDGKSIVALTLAQRRGLLGGGRNARR